MTPPCQGFDITYRYTTHSRDSSRLAIGQSQRQSQDTDIHALGGIRTRNPSKQRPPWTEWPVGSAKSI